MRKSQSKVILGGSFIGFLRIYNPDGSEAEKSGNGTRIFARYLVDEGYRSSPHCIIPVTTLSKDLALEIGPYLKNHVMFPNRINVQFLKVIDDHNIQIEIWERGAGYTLASGSSSCAAAAAAAAFRLELIKNTVKVHMPGGELDIVIQDNYKVQMTGPVVFVSKGLLSDEIFDCL